MAREKVISGIDIGTSKITTLIATITDEQEARVIGVSTVASHGLRKGQVVNIEEATSAISHSLEAAERMAGISVTKAFLSVGGNHISSLNSHGVVAIAEPDKEITEQDVNRVIEAAKAVSLPSSREILHVLPRGYVVDGQEGVVDPIGMSGIRLEVDTHLVTGGTTAIRNLQKCVEELGVEVVGMVFGGYASAISSITDTEKELGVILIDIGGGTTDVALFVDGALSYSSVIPIGAINITKDLAAGLRISLESAEKIKLYLSDHQQKVPNFQEMAMTGMKKSTEKTDDIDLTHLGLPEELKTVSHKTLVEGIIKPRLNEIFTMVGLEIKRSGYGGMTPSGVVVTGGGAQTVGAIDAARKNLAMPVHVGIPKRITGLVDEIMSPAFCSCTGLLLYGLRYDQEESGALLNNFSKIRDKMQIKGIAGKVVDLVKSFLP